jgi:PAS domain S-box-containing protein
MRVHPSARQRQVDFFFPKRGLGVFSSFVFRSFAPAFRTPDYLFGNGMADMNPDELFRRYQELQQYVGWMEEDAQRVRSVADLLERSFPTLVDDFYAEIARHPGTQKVLTGGAAQVQRLKGTLTTWLRELLGGRYDADYVARRWRVGWRHVEIGLDQVFANAALSRLRSGLLRVLEECWQGDLRQALLVRRSLNTLLDLDLAIIEDAYQAEQKERMRQAEGQRISLAKQHSEAAFRTLVEAAPCMIVILRPDHTLAYFSRFAAEVTGFRDAEVLGKDYLLTFLPEEWREPVVANIRCVLAGSPTRGLEAPVRSRDGSLRSMLWNAQLLPDYEGGAAILFVGQDITALKRAQEQALQSERLAAIGQMVTGLAHESGNALARARACLDMLSWEIHEQPEAQELIEGIRKAQDHLQQLYEEVRGYAAPLRLNREITNVAAVWRQAWRNLELQRQGRDAMLHEETTGVNLDCAIDPFRMEQVFRNVLENSLAACQGPVRIDVHCSEVNVEARPALKVVVRDNGPGLTPEQVQRIFEPFFTTKTKGTGLGMAIARRILEAHGGRIAVGAGSPGAEIILFLPRDNG